MNPSVSVVIPFVRTALVGDQLNSLAAQDYEGLWEVVVSHNGLQSDDLTPVRSLAEEFPAFQLVCAHERQGLCYARNKGASVATGSLLLFVDDDDAVEPQWIAEMAKALMLYDLVGGKMDLRELNATYQWSWDDIPDNGLYGGNGCMEFASGSNFGIRREIFDAIGGWSEEIGGPGEDTELCWRAQLAGYTLGFAPNAVVHRRLRTKLRDLAKQHFYYGMVGVRLQLDPRYRNYCPMQSIRDVLGKWLWVVIHLPDLVTTKARCGRYVRTTAFLIGRCVGLIRYYHA
jgi:GT2 family glycosyltransferase